MMDGPEFKATVPTAIPDSLCMCPEAGDLQET